MSAVRPLQNYLDLGAQDHVTLLHQAHNSNVCLATVSPLWGWKEWNYPVEQAGAKANALSLLDIDTYTSQNAFRYGQRRAVSNVSCLASFFVDLDIYNTEHQGKDWAEIYRAVESTGLPPPTLGGSSGRGLQLVWTFKTTKSPKLLDGWQFVEQHLIKVFSDFGADPKASDAARVLRLSGTINTKSGTRALLQVIGEPVTFESMVKWANSYRDVLKAAQPQPAPRVSKQAGTRSHLKAVESKNQYTLHLNRMNDLRTLAKVRGGRFSDHRAMALFVYATSAAWYCKDPGTLQRECEEFARRFFHDPERYTAKKVQTVIRRAEDAKAKKRHQWQGREVDPRYKLRNDKIIAMLDITAEEMRHLSTIINKAEKERRRTLKRRQQGIKPRGQYLAASEKKRQIAMDLRASGMTQRAIAEQMGISLGSVNCYLK